MEINYEVAFNLSSKINEKDKAKIKQLKAEKNQLREGIEKAIKWSEGGNHTLTTPIRVLLEEVAEILQKTIGGQVSDFIDRMKQNLPLGEIGDELLKECKQLEDAKKEVFKYLDEHYLTSSVMGEIEMMWDSYVSGEAQKALEGKDG